METRYNQHMSIQLPTKGFRHIDGPHGTLVVPGKTKWKWSVQERAFRSLLVRNGKVVSAGWPKFGNLGEHGFEDHAKTIQRAFQQGEPVEVFEKIDGVLMIRSVIDGKVVFRTRATQTGGEHAGLAWKIARKSYPKLLDPTEYTEQSLLFEMVSSEFRIVLDYGKDDLVFLGGVHHSDLTIFDSMETSKASKDLDLMLCKIHSSPRSLKEAEKLVNTLCNSEGVVVRCGQVMIKIKTKDYLSLHKLRANLDKDNVIARCKERNIESVKEWEQFLGQEGSDWEVFVETKEIVERFIEARQNAQELFASMDQEILAICLKTPRKQQSKAVREAFAHPEAALLLLDGKERAALGVLEDQFISTI